MQSVNPFALLGQSHAALHSSCIGRPKHSAARRFGLPPPPPYTHARQWLRPRPAPSPPVQIDTLLDENVLLGGGPTVLQSSHEALRPLACSTLADLVRSSLPRLTQAAQASRRPARPLLASRSAPARPSFPPFLVVAARPLIPPSGIIRCDFSPPLLCPRCTTCVVSWGSSTCPVWCTSSRATSMMCHCLSRSRSPRSGFCSTWSRASSTRTMWK